MLPSFARLPRSNGNPQTEVCATKPSVYRGATLYTTRHIINGRVHVMQKAAGRTLSAICLAVLFSTLPAISGGNPSNRQADVIQTSRGEVRIMPVYHGSVMLECGGKVIHVDPWSQGDFTGLPPADLIVITHTHQDHLDRTMVDMLKKPETIIVGPPAVIDTLNCAPACGIVEAISDSEKRTGMGIGIEGGPVYNLVVGSGAGKTDHP